VSINRMWENKSGALTPSNHYPPIVNEDAAIKTVGVKRGRKKKRRKQRVWTAKDWESILAATKGSSPPAPAPMPPKAKRAGRRKIQRRGQY